MKTLSHSCFFCRLLYWPHHAPFPILPNLPTIPTLSCRIFREPLYEKNIPYPRLDEQTQIDHLGIQIARLERTVEELNQRLHTLEQQRNIKRPTSLASNPKAQRLDDRKLKMNYLANGGGVPSETDSASPKRIAPL